MSYCLNFKKICLLIIVLCFQNMPLHATENIKIEVFHGPEIAPYIKDIASLCNSIYRDAPYLYNGEDADYNTYVESYTESNDTIICLAFDQQEIIGLALGMPMEQSRDLYKPTLIEHGFDLQTMYYFGEFGLRNGYQNRGIEISLYAHMEKTIRESGAFDKIAIWEIEGSKNKFLSEFGFLLHPELNFHISWTHIGDTQETEHLATYSIKNL